MGAYDQVVGVLFLGVVAISPMFDLSHPAEKGQYRAFCGVTLLSLVFPTIWGEFSKLCVVFVA